MPSWPEGLAPLTVILKVLRDQSPGTPSQEVLAQRAGFSLSKLALMESGARPVRMEDLAGLGQGLGVEPGLLHRVARILQGYLWSDTVGEFWWMDFVSDKERERFDRSAPVDLAAEEADRWSEEAADAWFEYCQKRFRKQLLESVRELFRHTDTSVSWTHDLSAAFPSRRLEFTLGPTSRRRTREIVSVPVDPPMLDPIASIREMHRKAPGNHAVLSQLSEVLSKQEVALVVSYALGLIEGRPNAVSRSSSKSGRNAAR